MLGGKENKSLIIYLEDTSTSTFSPGLVKAARPRTRCVPAEMLCRVVGKLWSHEPTAADLARCFLPPDVHNPK